MKYTFPLYIPAIAVAVAIIACAAGIYLVKAKKSLRAIVITFIIAVLAGGIVAPMLAMDRVILDDQKLEQTTGFWFAPTIKGFRLAEVSSIRIGTARNHKNREYEIWSVHYVNGRTKVIDPGDLWAINAPDIIRRLQSKGIDIK